MTAKKPYHKENLRRDLLAAGRDFVKANGYVHLSIRTLAQQVGVSPGAPYHHFPDRRSFLLALACQGFEDMMDGTKQVLASKMSPEDKLRRMGTLFIRYAEDNPHMVDLMYESELTIPVIDPQLVDYQVIGHQSLRKNIADAVPGLSEEELDLRTITYWSAIYGFASMRKKGVVRVSRNLASIDIADALVDRAAVSALAR